MTTRDRPTDSFRTSSPSSPPSSLLHCRHMTPSIYPGDIVPLAQVCGYRRDIAFRQPELWSDGHLKGQNPELVSRQVTSSRCRGVPLMVYLNLPQWIFLPEERRFVQNLTEPCCSPQAADKYQPQRLAGDCPHHRLSALPRPVRPRFLQLGRAHLG